MLDGYTKLLFTYSKNCLEWLRGSTERSARLCRKPFTHTYTRQQKLTPTHRQVHIYQKHRLRLTDVRNNEKGHNLFNCLHNPQSWAKVFHFPCFPSGLMYIPSSTRSLQGIVSPEYVTFQPSQWLSATPNELKQCLTGTVLMFFMCRDANNREYKSASTLHLPMCCKTDKYDKLTHICTNKTLESFVMMMTTTTLPHPPHPKKYPKKILVSSLQELLCSLTKQKALSQTVQH